MEWRWKEWPLVAMALIAVARSKQCGPFTSSDIEGPFFLPDAPRRQNVAPHEELADPAEAVIVQGQLLDRRCEPLVNATIDLWYAGKDGSYSFDKVDMLYRGQQNSDKQGKYKFRATYPGIYDIRPIRHFHVKVVAKEKEFITQIYFEGEIPPDYESYVKNRQSQIVSTAKSRVGKITFNIKMDV